MADINKLLGQLLNSSAAGGFAGGLAGGLASNLLTTKKGRKMSKKALKMGGIAAVGALAYGAYQKYSNQTTPSAQPLSQQGEPQQLQQPPEGSTFIPPKNDRHAQDQLGMTLVRAMIAAARSDGTLDAQESQTIFQRIQSLPLEEDEKNLLVEEMGRPVDIDILVREATNVETASEIYVASLLAIDVDTPEEQSYLAMLAARLKLPQDLVKKLHQEVETQLVPVPT